MQNKNTLPSDPVDLELALEIAELIKAKPYLHGAPIEIARCYRRRGRPDRAGAVIADAFQKHKKRGKKSFAWHELSEFLTTAPPWKDREAYRDFLQFVAGFLEGFKNHSYSVCLYGDLLKTAWEAGEHEFAEKICQSAMDRIKELRSDKQRVGDILRIAAFRYLQGNSEAAELLIDEVSRILDTMKNAREFFLHIAEYFKGQNMPGRALEFFDKIKRPGRYEILNFCRMTPMLAAEFGAETVVSRWGAMFKATPQKDRKDFMETILNFLDEKYVRPKKLPEKDRPKLITWSIDTMKRDGADSYADILPLFEFLLSGKPLDEAVDAILDHPDVTDAVKFRKSYEAAALKFQKGDKKGALELLAWCESCFMKLRSLQPPGIRSEEFLKPAIGYACCGQPQSSLRLFDAVGGKDALSGKSKVYTWSSLAESMLYCGLTREVRDSLPKAKENIENLTKDRLMNRAYYARILAMLGEKEELRNYVELAKDEAVKQKGKDEDTNKEIDHDLFFLIRGLLAPRLPPCEYYPMGVQDFFSGRK